MIVPGQLTENDWAVLSGALARAPSLAVCEVGVASGATARAIREFTKGRELSYFGVELEPMPPPFEGAKIAIGDSADVHTSFAGPFDVVLIDGCHCQNHVMLDFLNYGLKVRPGGFVLFHDTWEQVQGTNAHANQATLEHGKKPLGVLKAISALGLGTARLDFVMDSQNRGAYGITCYRRKVY